MRTSAFLRSAGLCSATALMLLAGCDGAQPDEAVEPLQDELAQTVTATDAGVCPQELPKEGFVLKGCGKDGVICHIAQTGCTFQATCGSEVFQGRMATPGVYEFTTAEGARCTGKVEDGKFVGTCATDKGSCSFEPGEPAPVEGCYALPKAGFTTAGCGGAMTCDVVQSGCKWQAKCTTGRGGTLVYGGESSESRITFPGRNNYACWAEQEPNGTRLVGGCSLDGEEVSECSARVEGGRLVLTPR